MRWWCGFMILWLAIRAHASPSVEVVLEVPEGANAKAISQVFEQARQARRKLPVGAQGSIRVVFPPGDFPVFDPVELTPEDSGTEAVPLVLEGRVDALGQRPRWVGAWRLNDPSVGGRGRWEYMLPSSRRTPDFRAGGQFFLGTQRGLLARSPNAGQHFLVKAPVTVEGKGAFLAQIADAERLADLATSDRDRAWLHLWQSWTTGRHRIGAVSTSSGRVDITPAANWAFHQFGSSQRYALENALSALDAPGEWLMLKDRALYMPRPGDVQSTTAYMPVNERLLVLRGEPERGRWVEHVQIKGLEFAYTYQPLIGGAAQGDWQAAVHVPAAIEIRGGRFIRMDECKVSQTGGYAVWLRAGTQHVTINRCVMRDLGAGGVKIGEPSEPRSGALATGFNRVLHSVVSDVGVLFPGAPGIWLGHTFGNLVQSNVVSNTRYSGISVGWQWGYGRATSGDNQIERNVLWNIGQGQLADLAGIYTLGRSPGTRVVGNVIRKVRGYDRYGAGAWGLYADEGSSELLFRDNVVIDAASGGFHLHYGRDLTVANNFFLAGGAPEVSWTDVRQSGGWSLDSNVMIGTVAQAFSVMGPDGALDAKNNLVPDASRSASGVCARGCLPRAGMRLVIPGRDLAVVQVEGLTTERAQVLGRILSAAQSRVDDVRRVASGVLPVVGSPEFQWLPAQKLSEAVMLNFAEMPMGSQPAPLRYSPSQRPDLARVEPDPSGQRKRCLRLTDGVAGMASFDPHVFLDYRAQAGRLGIEFEVWVDDATRLVHEWRDGSEPFRTGPSLTLRGDGLEVAGRTLMNWQSRAWYKIRLEASLGEGRASKWDLKVQMPDGTARQWKGLPLNSASWNHTGWIGWVSSTERASTTCLANLGVRNF